MIKQNREKRPESSSLAWISCFWAQYNILPEPFKKGFFSLVQHVAKGNFDEARNKKNYRYCGGSTQ